MVFRSLGLMALLLLNQAASAIIPLIDAKAFSSEDTAIERAELAYPPIVNQSREWSVQPFGGFVLPHHTDMMAMYKHANGVGIRYRAAMKAEEGLGVLHDKLTYGFTVNLMDLGSAEAGYGIGTGALLMAQSGRNGYFLFGMGIGYLSQKFDALSNPRNVAIGSRYNGTMQLGYHWELKTFSKAMNMKIGSKEIDRLDLENKEIKDLWKLSLELGLMHFSNANWSQPNFGINVPYLGIGIKRALIHSYFHSYNDQNRLGVYPTTVRDLRESEGRGWKHPLTYNCLPSQTDVSQDSLATLNLGLSMNKPWREHPSKSLKLIYVPQWSHAIGFRVGRRQIELDQRKTFTNVLFDYVAENRSKTMGHRWRYGLNIFFDKSYLYTKFAKEPEGYGLKDFTEVAATFGHRWQFGRWGIIADAGFYLYRPSDMKRAYYEGVGVIYRVSPKIQATARLKAHLSTADYMEWGLSYFL